MAFDAPSRPPPDHTDSFTPKLVTVWREGYGLANLRADVAAGLTVAFAEKAHKRGAQVFIAGASRAVTRSLLSAGLSRRLVRYAPNVTVAHERTLRLLD